MFHKGAILKKRLLLFFISFLGMATIFQSSYANTNVIHNLEGLKVVRSLSHTKCGKVLVVDKQDWENRHIQKNYLSVPGRQYLKYKRHKLNGKKYSTDEFSYQTRESILYVKDSDAIGKSERSLKKYLYSILFEDVWHRTYDLMQHEFNELIMNNERLIHLKSHLDGMSRKLLKKDILKYHKQLNLILSIYPQIADTIKNDPNEQLRPLLCQLEDTNHNMKNFYRWSNALGIPALGLGLSSLIVGSGGAAIPALTIAAGAAACLVGAKDLTYGLYWRSEKKYSAKIAKQMMFMNKNFDNTRKKLLKIQKSGDISKEEVKLLAKLENHFKMSLDQRNAELKKIVNSKNKNLLLITFGFLNFGFNSVNLTGDATLLASLPGMILSIFP